MKNFVLISLILIVAVVLWSVILNNKEKEDVQEQQNINTNISTSTVDTSNNNLIATTSDINVSPIKIRQATQSEISAVVDANNQFAIDLYSRYSSIEKGNIFFSPYSITTALAMTYEAARGQTATEMAKVLYFPENTDARRAGMASIYNRLNAKNKPYTLKTANALWAEKDFEFLNDYLTIVKNYYGGGVTNLDFKNNWESARKTINAWVESQTNNKIKNLIPVGLVDKTTRLVLTNAIYFKGTWVLQFDKKETKEEDFNTGTTVVKSDMMSLVGEKAKFKYTETDKVQAIELPYKGKELSMFIILPKDNDISVLEKIMNKAFIDKMRTSLNEQRVNVYLPKFKFETKYFMGKDLKDMGMPSAFDPDLSDFSGMFDRTKTDENLSISEVIHQAFVEVNEEGTEAAAATAVIMVNTTSVGPGNPIPEFRADHPFIFMIQDSSTGEILFMGKVANPIK
ncbi:MAG: serpin family protein [Candidatus Paceibacterota bacterium]|jgi:serpin B